MRDIPEKAEANPETKSDRTPHDQQVIECPAIQQQQYFFDSMIDADTSAEFLRQALESHTLLDLAYPLLDRVITPPHHLRLSKNPFLKPRHTTLSYAEALGEYFPEIPKDFTPEPYLDIGFDADLLNTYGLNPLSYFTVHSGSDFAPKNWPPENFEEVVLKLLNLYPKLKCIGVVGPCDTPLFTGRSYPDRFQNLSVPLETLSRIFAGSLFHLDNDSGIHHLAGIMNIPTISVWGPTPPGTWGSLTSRNFIHWGGPNCLDHCGGSRMVMCSDRVCINSVKPIELVQSARQIMSAYELCEEDRQLRSC